VLTPVLPGDLIQVEDRSPSRAFATLERSDFERNNIAEMRAGQNRHEPMVSSETWPEVDGKHAHLSANQRAAVEQIVSSQDKIVGLEGVAGAGETTSLAAVREAAEQEGYEVRGLAPTPRAAHKLAESGIEAETLQGHGDRFARWCLHASLPTPLLPGIPTTENKNRHFLMEMRHDVPHLGESLEFTLLFDRHTRCSLRSFAMKGQVSAAIDLQARPKVRHSPRWRDRSSQITPQSTVLPGFPTTDKGSVMNVRHLASLLYRVVDDDNTQFGSPDSKGRAWDLNC
jgi:hypothetical protein